MSLNYNNSRVYLTDKCAKISNLFKTFCHKTVAVVYTCGSRSVWAEAARRMCLWRHQGLSDIRILLRLLLWEGVLNGYGHWHRRILVSWQLKENNVNVLTKSGHIYYNIFRSNSFYRYRMRIYPFLINMISRQ